MICTLLSWNIWSRDGLGFRWVDRRKPLLAFIRESKADVVGLQEVRTSWLADLREALPEYECVSLSRDESPHAECTPVFIRRNFFILKRTESCWLSKTPELKSLGWDAWYPRVMVLCHVETQVGGWPLLIANTHLDHWGKESRKKSVELMRTLLGKKVPEPPAIVMGDFNFRPTEEAYRMMTGDGLYVDSEPSGSTFTWSGWGLGSLGQARLDYLFSRKLKFQECRTVHPPWNRRRLSDHNALWARFTLGENA